MSTTPQPWADALAALAANHSIPGSTPSMAAPSSGNTNNWDFVSALSDPQKYAGDKVAQIAKADQAASIPFDTQPRRHHVRPTGMEMMELRALLPALADGLDPSLAGSVIGGVQSDLSQRQAAYHQQQQAHRQMLQQLLPQAEQSIVSQEQAGIPESAVLGGFSAYGPGVQGQLETIANGVYGGSGSGTQGAPLDPTIASTLQKEVFSSATPVTDKITGQVTPAKTLHQARMIWLPALRAQGLNPAQIISAYNLIGQLYLANGEPKLLDAPLTWDQAHPDPTAQAMTPQVPHPNYEAQPPTPTSVSSGPGQVSYQNPLNLPI